MIRRALCGAGGISVGAGERRSVEVGAARGRTLSKPALGPCEGEDPLSASAS